MRHHDRVLPSTGLGGVYDNSGNGLPSSDQLIARGVDAGENWVMEKLGVSKGTADVVNAISNIGADALEGYLTGVAITVGAEAVGGLAAAAVASVSVPIIGEVVGAIIGLVVLFKALESCSVGVNDTPVGPVSFDCDYYAGTVIPGALDWIQKNPAAALKLTPAEFAHQTSIYVWDYPMTAIDDSGSTVRIPPWAPFGDNPDGSPITVPGAQSMLHLLQLTTASSIAAAFPTLIDLFKVTFRDSFPLITDEEYADLWPRIEPLRQAFLVNAIKWGETVWTPGSFRPPPTAAQIHQYMPVLTPADAQRVADHLAAERRHANPITNINLVDTPPTSTAAKVATTTAVAGGAGALALAFYATKNGISFAQAAKNVYVHGKSLGKRLVSRAEK